MTAIFQLIQNEYLYQKVPWSIIIQKESFHNYKREVIKQIQYLKEKKYENTSVQIKILVNNISNALNNVLRNIVHIEQDTKEISTMKEV